MSDKSKLGFNINPKNYDELNSTDNLITSGSDSGWLGKKLQGDNTSTIDLSKINPLFDKELYEKYRPGVNTNDGSVNQDIWGYKCFNSPVSFGQSAYMLSVCTDMDMPNKIYYASVYDQPSIGYSVKSAKTNLITIHSNYNNGALSYLRSIHSNRSYDDYCNQSFDDPDFHGHDSESIVNSDKRHHKADNIDNISDNIIQIGNQSKHCNTMLISRITSDIYGDLEYIQQGLDDQTGDVGAFFILSDMQKYNSMNESRTTVTSSDDLYTYSTNISGMSSFYHSPNKHAQDAKYKGIANRQSVIVLDSSFLNSDNSNDVDFTNYNGNATITLNAPVHHAPRHCLNYNGKIGLEISERYTFIGNTDTPQNITKSGYTYIEKDTISLGVTNSINPSVDNPYIKIDGTDNSITLHAGKLNLPDTIETTAKFANKAGTLSKEINSANYIYATDNSILPSNDSVISLGDLKTKYNTIYTNKLIATDESTIANLIIKNNLTYSDFSNHVVKYKLKNTVQPGINHAVTQSYKSNYANNELSILYTESFNIGTDHRCNIYKEYGYTNGICIYGDDDGYGTSNIVIGSTRIPIMDPSRLRPLYAVHTEIVTSNVILKRNHSSFKIGTINAIGSGEPLNSIIITPTYGDIYDIYVFRKSVQNFSYTCTNLTGLSQKNGLILPGTIMLPRLRTTAEDPYYYTRVVVENTVNSDITLQKDEVVFSGFNASQPIAEYGDYYVVLEHRDDLAYEVLETVFIKVDEVYFKCKVKVVDRYAAEKFSAIV